LPRLPLPEQVREILLTRIVDGGYPPGARLVETAIARELGVSQGPVREALRQLAGMGLVEYQSHRGYRVRTVDQREIDEVSVVRAALEETAARLAAHRPIDPGPPAREIDGMRTAAVRRDQRAWVGHATRFHRLVVEAAGNRTLLTTWEALSIEARTAQLVLSAGFDLVRATQEHAAIIDAVVAGDAARAARLSREHEESFVLACPAEVAQPPGP
jgi:DNA-binding GntR family transcriptional regulator